MKLLMLIIGLVLFAVPVQGGLIADVGNSFRSMLNDGNFLYFFFYLLIFVILLAIFNAAGAFLPMFKENERNRKVFAVTLSLLVTTLMFVNYRGSFMDMILDSLDPYGEGALIMIGIVALLFLLFALFKKVGGAGGGSTGTVGSVFKWITIGILVLLALFILSSMFGGGGGFSLGGNVGDWIALIIGLVLIGLVIYFLFKGLTGSGGGGGGGSESKGPGLWSRLKDKLFGDKDKRVDPSKEEKKKKKAEDKEKKKKIKDEIKRWENETTSNNSFQPETDDFSPLSSGYNPR